MALKEADKKVIDAFTDGALDIPEGPKSAFYARGGTLYGPANSKLARLKYEWVTWIGVGGTKYQDDTYRYLKKTVPAKRFKGHGASLQENGKSVIWQIPYHVWAGDDDRGFASKIWVQADTLEEAVEYLVESCIEQGDSVIWGADDDYDPGSVDSATSRDDAGDLYEDQLWQISGVDSSSDLTEEERDDGLDILTKNLKIFPDEAKEVSPKDVAKKEKLLVPNGVRISGKQRAMLAIMHEAWKDGGRAASFIVADQRKSVAGLIQAGLAEETSRGKYAGQTEVFAKLTPAGLEQVKHLVPNSKASMGFVIDARTQDFLRPANRSDMLKSLQSPTGEFSEGGRRVLVRNGAKPHPRPPRPQRAPVLIPERKRHGTGKTFPSLQSFVQSSVKSQTGAGDIRRMQAAHEEELYPWRSDLRPNGGMTYFDKKARFGVTNNPQGKLVAFGDGVDKNRLALRASDFRENKAGVWVGPKATVENFRDVVLDLFEVDVPTEGLKDAKAADWALERNSSTSEEDWGSEEILRGMVLGFWLQGWAAAMEEAGLRVPKNITEENAPEPPEELTDFAMSFANRLLDLNGGMDLFQLSKRVGVDASEREEFGYLLAMESLGHGVSWSDDHDDHGLKVPDTEVGFSLEDPDDEDSAQLDYAAVASK